jgi:hypothetical protein
MRLLGYALLLKWREDLDIPVELFALVDLNNVHFVSMDDTVLLKLTLQRRLILFKELDTSPLSYGYDLTLRKYTKGWHAG